MYHPYPLLSQDGIEMDIQESNYYPASANSSMVVRNQLAQPVHQLHHAQSAHPLARDTTMPLIHHRESLPKAFPLKRSISNPNVRPQGTNNSDRSQIAEKKRNKLGYHRTSVACGHCRRRKTRCIPHQSNNRCINCIRLKKDCSFQPMGEQQQSAPAPAQKPGNQSSVGHKIASVSSSPAMSTSHLSDGQPHLTYPKLPTMLSNQHMGPQIIKADLSPSDTKMSTNASNAKTFNYGHGNTNWIPSEISPDSAKTPGDLNAPWRSYSYESPVTPAFPPYASHSIHSSASWSATLLGTSGSDEASYRPEKVAWSPHALQPPRSLSYGGETYQSYTTHPQIGSSQSATSYQRKPSMTSGMYQPPVVTTMPAIESVSTNIHPQDSLSAGVAHSNEHDIRRNANVYTKSVDGCGDWYNDGVGPQVGGLYYGNR